MTSSRSREVIRLKLPELRLSEITVEVKVVGEPPAALVNAGQIRQVLHNLISNSAQAIQEEKERGWIGITVASAEAHWLDVTVEDDGPGIPDEVLDQVMSPFFTTKVMGKGTGLGLSVCRDIVESSGGEIQIRNRDAEDQTGSTRADGVRVSIRSPAGPAGKVAEEIESGSIAPSPEVTGSARILIIDDDVAVASTLKRLVERLGHAAEVAHRAEAALNRIKNGESLDLILSDLKMPGAGGEGLYRELERLRPELLDRLVFMSGDLTPEADHDFLREGSCATLEKPFTRERLRDTLESALKRRQE